MLTEKQKIFVDEYLIDLNATRAYKAAYPKVKNDSTAAAAGARLLRNVKVQSYIEQRMKERAQRTEITQDKVVQELAKIAFSKGTDFVRVVTRTGYRPLLDDEGNVIDQEPYEYQAVEILNTDEIPEDSQAAIAGIKQGANGIEVKLNDKVKALELLGRHLGMFSDKLEVTGDMNNPFAGLTTEELKKLIQNG
jgi:phage terminase small subunit